MSGELGGLRVDRRPAEMMGQSEPSTPSTVAARADRADPGEWSEGLEPFGVVPWELPGQGDRGAGCGEYRPMAVCETCGEPEFRARVCGKRSCPDCWGVWARDAAVRATARVQGFRHTQPPDWHRQAAHGVMSPPEGAVKTKREFWKGKKKAAEMAKEKGWRGFSVIPHPYRVTEEGKERYREEDPDYGIWVWLRNDVEGMSRYIYWSPHYHIVGVTGADMDPANDGDDWVYYFRRSVESFEGTRDRESHEDVYGLYRYLLSHTGYPAESTKQVVTWYGSLANSVFVENATEEWQREKPSEGVRKVIEREIEAVAGPGEIETGEEGGVIEEEDVQEECPREECDGELIDVFDVSAFLRQRDPGRDVAERMEAARDWRLGRVEPPPGLKRPRSEDGAKEAFRELVE